MIRGFTYRVFRVLAVCAVATGALNGVGIAVADDGDQDRARAAMLRGEVEPLSKALGVIEQNIKGDIIEVEFEEEDKFGIGPVIIYEVKVLSPDGRVMKVKINAKTLEVLTVDGDVDASARLDD